MLKFQIHLFTFNPRGSLFIFVCTDAICSTKEARSMRACCRERKAFLFWYGAITSFPMFDILVLVLFISSQSCCSSDSDGMDVLLNFFFNNFDFNDKDAEKVLPLWSLKFDPRHSSKLSMKKTTADSAACSISSLVSENIGLRYFYHRGSI